FTQAQMKLRWTARARRDLFVIGRHIACDDPVAARRWVDRLRARARAAAQHPLAGRMVPEVVRRDIREVLLGNYRLVYRVRRKQIEMLTVSEGHRLLRSADLSE